MHFPALHIMCFLPFCACPPRVSFIILSYTFGFVKYFFKKNEKNFCEADIRSADVPLNEVYNIGNTLYKHIHSRSIAYCAYYAAAALNMIYSNMFPAVRKFITVKINQFFQGRA